MAPSSPRVLCYAPYNRWALHGQWEMTILHALKLRGAEVSYVLCDGLFTECDQFWAAHAPRPANACVSCQADVTKLCAELGMDYRWLGRYLTTDEHRAARAWAAAVPDAELLTATYGAWPIAAWTRMSLQSHFRANEPDLADPVVVRTVRGYLEAGLIAAFALDRLLEESAPDVLLLFNGRQSSLRVALELARARGIRVVTHERGHRPETLMLVENASCLSLERIRRYWREWGEIPLTAAEAEPIAQLMQEREHGRGLAWKALTAPPTTPPAEVRAQLGLTDASRPLWVLFTSSDDELAGDLDWGSAFPSQRGWIDRTIAFARAHPQIDLVVRIHPNTGSKRSHGVNAAQLAEMATLHDDVPPNVRVIAPDVELSAYSLMDLATVGLVWVSTAGLEMACKGKRVLVAASNPISDTEFVTASTDPDRYEDQLGELLAVPAGAVSAQTRRLALRFAYGFFFRMSVDFPLVRMPNPHQGVVGWTAPGELTAGRDAGLDRCVRILLDGEATCPPPNAVQRARTTDAEDALLAPFGRLTALAFAEELIADATLLTAWARAFDGRDDATLVIHTLAEHAEALVAAVTRLGLEGEDGPDLLAIEADARLAGSVDAIFSRLDLGADGFTAPRYDDTTVERLASAR